MAYDGRLLSGVTVLMAVVEAGSMARAAEGLGLTPSGVGRAIQRLEARIGVRLLDRTTRTMRLTEEGRRFHENVGPLLDGIEAAALEAAGAAVRVRGRLRVNIDPFFSQVLLADHVAEFLASYPEVRLRIVPEHPEDGVVAKTETREYFFATDWVRSMSLERVREEVRRMKEAGSSFLPGKYDC